MDSYEKDIKDLIQQMQRQQNMAQQIPNQASKFSPSFNESLETDQSPHLFNQNQKFDSPDQSPINPVNSVRPMGPSISQARKTGVPLNKTVAVADGACPQCGILHPPIPPGSKCPLAPVKVKDGNDEKTVDVSKFLADLKNIIVSQAEHKKIKDVEKLFKNIIIEVTKFIEGYTE